MNFFSTVIIYSLLNINLLGPWNEMWREKALHQDVLKNLWALLISLQMTKHCLVKK